MTAELCSAKESQARQDRQGRAWDRQLSSTQQVISLEGRPRIAREDSWAWHSRAGQDRQDRE
eukprot:3297770-Rhodomonas_salina.1